MSTLVRINRICAWILLALMVIFIVTGYSWHNHIIMNPRQAAQIHTTLDPVLVLFFLIHTMISVRFTLMRQGLRGRSIDLLLLFIGLLSYLAVLRVAL
ncbi:MAG TPA: hypothetical protein PK659_05540 [Methanothrix sp.]|nr:hypothetical protein [Methanothrix sp.]HOK58529.1 hypothetical protein [Methanothrix sp.]HOL43698.1 hypothetical protein [Methanothrix sp.]HPO88744.1 hypothetical protein [Methanothrix sp.]